MNIIHTIITMTFTMTTMAQNSRKIRPSRCLRGIAMRRLRQKCQILTVQRLGRLPAFTSVNKRLTGI